MWRIVAYTLFQLSLPVLQIICSCQSFSVRNINRRIVLRKHLYDVVLVKYTSQVQCCVSFKILQSHISVSLKQCLYSNFVPQYTPKHQRSPFLQKGSSIYIDILLNQFSYYLRPFIASTYRCQMNSILAFSSHNSSRLNRVFVVTS